jgi:hypothetical protein
LTSYARCAQQKHLTDLQRAGMLDKEPEQLSLTAFGTVIHHAARVLEEEHHKGGADPLGKARATFEYYWAPENIHHLTPPVTIWTPRDTWTGSLRRGLAVLGTYYDQLVKDKGKLLGLEVEFTLPYLLDGEWHEIHGTMDRLSLRRTSGGPYLNIEDFKSGRDYIGLRWNVQFTVYSWATLQPAFWDAWGAESADLAHRFANVRRRGTWISLRDGVKRSDAGYRGPQDYARMDVALREYVKAVRLDVYPLTLSGSVCRFCPFREGLCGGVPIPDENYGA